MMTLDALQIECAADVQDGKRTVTFTEWGGVCFDPGDGYDGAPGVLCEVETLPDSIREKLTQGHMMALEAQSVLIEALQEAQGLGFGGPEDALYAGR